MNKMLLIKANRGQIVVGRFNNNLSISLWDIFETLTFWELGTLFECPNSNVKQYISKIMKLSTNYDADGLMS